MAELIDLNINIGANTTDFQGSLQKAENLLKQFEAALKKATNVGEINYLNGQIKNLQGTIAGINTQMGGVVKPTTDATNALMNLSRVAQDAPYGFMGIANNLNPLLESFQRLQTETGSSKKALDVLLDGLSGPAGLGLALGAISSIAVVFSKELSNAFKGPTDKLKTLREELKKLNEEIYKIAGAAQANQTLGTVLVGRITNENLDINQRQTALKKFKDLYTQNKDIQSLQIKDLKTYNAQFLQSLNNKAAIQQLEISKEKNYTDALTQANAAYKRLIDERNNLKANTYATTKQLEMGTTTAMLRSAIDAQYVKPLQEAQNDIKKAKDALTRTIDQSVQFDIAGGEDKKGPKKKIKKILSNEERSALLKQIYRTSTLLTPLEEAPKEKDTAIEDAQNKHNEYLKWLTGWTKRKEKLTQQNYQNEQKDLEDLTKKYEQFSMTIASTVTGALVGMFDAMQQGVSAGDALAQMFGRLAQQIAQTLVQAAIFAGVFSIISGGAGVEGGLSFMGAFKKILGLADGGVATGPTLAMIGEGSESEAVLPLSKLGGMLDRTFNAGAMSGGNISQNGQFVLKGNDLVLALQRSNTSLNLRRGI